MIRLANTHNQIKALLQNFFEGKAVEKLSRENAFDQKFLKQNHLAQAYYKAFNPSKYQEQENLRHQLLQKCKAMNERHSLNAFYLKSFRHYDFFDTNLDIVIMSDFKEYKKILRYHGFRFKFNFADIREPLKIHYIHPEIPLTLHVHQQVSWNGIIALDKTNVCESAQTIRLHNIDIRIPNEEYAYLIMAAHCVFENYYLNLGEILYCHHLLSQGIDCERLKKIAGAKNWDKGFFLFNKFLKTHLDQLNLSAQQLEHCPSISIKKEPAYPHFINYFSLIPGYWDKLRRDARKNLPNIPRQLFTYCLVGPLWRYAWARIKGRSRKKYLISISGLDGSGKTTIAKRLKEKLPHARYIHFISFRWVNKILGIFRKHESSAPENHRKPALAITWLNYCFLLTDIIIFNIYFKLSFCRYIICDRYVIDAVASLIDQQKSFAQRAFWKKIMTKPDLALFIDTDPKIAMQRESKGGHAIEFFEIRQAIYQGLIQSIDAKIIINDNIESCIESTEQLIHAHPPNIIFLSRPLTNALDEGSKSLIYYLVQNLNTPVSIFTSKQFRHALPSHIHKIPIMDEPETNIIEDSRALSIRLKQMLHLLKQPKGSIVHIYFVLNPKNAFTMLVLRAIKSFELNITITAISSRHIDNIFVRKLLSRAMNVIVQSSHTQGRVAHISRNLRRIEPYVSAKIFPEIQGSALQSFKSQHGLSGDFTVIYPGEYSRLNANESIASIIQETSKRHPNIQFVMLCRLKWEKDRIIEQKLKRELKGCRVKFLNSVDNIEGYISCADLTIFPAQSMEGKFDLPMTLIESIVAETPVLTSDVAPLNEIGGAKARTRADFVNEIGKIYTDKNYYKQLKNQTIKLKKRFVGQGLIRKYDQMYSLIN